MQPKPGLGFKPEAQLELLAGCHLLYRKVLDPIDVT